MVSKKLIVVYYHLGKNGKSIFGREKNESGVFLIRYIKNMCDCHMYIYKLTQKDGR